MLELCAEADLLPCIFLRRLLEVEPWRCNKQVQHDAHLCRLHGLQCCDAAHKP